MSSSSASPVPRSFSRANPNNLAIKRIMREYSEIQKDPSYEFIVAPLEENLFEWHFTIRGADETDYQGGRYHGRILFPSQYPFKPPDIMMLTPSGRFETHKKICLSNSSFHPDSWQPSWSVRTMLTAFIAFFPTPANGAIGSLDYTPKEKKEYARKSAHWKCEECKKTNIELLPELTKEERQKIDKMIVEKVKAAATKAPNSNNAESAATLFQSPLFQRAASQLSQTPIPSPTPTTPTQTDYSMPSLSPNLDDMRKVRSAEQSIAPILGHPLSSELLSSTPAPSSTSPISSAPSSPLSSPSPHVSPSPSPPPLPSQSASFAVPPSPLPASAASPVNGHPVNKTDRILMYLMLLVTFLILLLLFRKMYVAVYRPSLLPPVFQSDEL